MLETVWDPTALSDELVTLSAAEFLANRYTTMLVEGRAAIASGFALLADERAYPLVFHCAAGKDRTGVFAALLLDVLGVSDTDIGHDYSLSRLAMEQMAAWLEDHMPEAFDAMVAQPRAILDAPPLAIHLLLDRVRTEYGSVLGYLQDLGVSTRKVAVTRVNLLT